MMAADESSGTQYVLAANVMVFALAQTAVIPALPHIGAELDRNTADVAWILTGYFVSAAVCTPILGRLGDMWGRRRILMLAMALFALGSLISAVAPTLELVVLGRIVAGAGGGVLPLCFGIIRSTMGARQVPSTIGTLSAMAGLGASGGLFLGGVIMDLGGFRLLFWAGAVPAAVVCLVDKWRLPESDDKGGGAVDVVGAVLLSIGLTAPLLALSQGGAWGWSDARTLALAALGVLVLAAWVVHSLRASAPLIDLRLAMKPVLLRTNTTTLLAGSAIFVPFLLVPAIGQAPAWTDYGHGLTATEAGLLLVPGTLLSLFAGPLSGWISSRWGSRIALSLGCIVNAVGLAFLALSAGGGLLLVIVLTTVALVGGSIAFAAMANAIIEGVMPERTGEGTGVNAVVRSIGSSLGTQLVSAILVAGVVVGTGLPSLGAYEIAFVVGAGIALVAGATALTIPRVAR
ncbi:MFS transporter [Aeromicrobium sp. S22]|nr:MFS transporter [Aeromicrobium sp. S22]